MPGTTETGAGDNPRDIAIGLAGRSSVSFTRPDGRMSLYDTSEVLIYAEENYDSLTPDEQRALGEIRRVYNN